jgi:DNA primase
LREVGEPPVPVEIITDAGRPVKIDVQTEVFYQERETIRLLLNYADKNLEDHNVSEFLLHELEDVEFSNPLFKEVYDAFRDALNKGKSITSDYFLMQGSDAVKRLVSELVTQRYDTSPHWSDRYHIYFPKDGDELDKKALANVLHLKYRVVQKWIEDNKEKIKGTKDQKEEDELLERQTELKRLDVALAQQLGIVSGKY